MGFQCHLCHKDFGLDKNAYELHLKNNPRCDAFVSSIKGLVDRAINKIGSDDTISLCEQCYAEDFCPFVGNQGQSNRCSHFKSKEMATPLFAKKII